MDPGSLGENLMGHAGSPPLLLKEFGQMDDHILRVWFAHQDSESMPRKKPAYVHIRT